MPARILVIEDNQANLNLMRYLLNAFGYTVATANDGEAGLQAIREQPPDLIVCDIQLPHVDGYEVSRRLQNDSQFGRIPRIAVSALAMVGDRDRILSAGFHGYIAKPIVPTTFVEQLEEFLPVELQASERPPQLHSASTEDIKSREKNEATILAVDDVAANLLVLESVLEPCGYQLFKADSSTSAIAILAECVPDLILCDLHMPREEEFCLLAHIKSTPLLRDVPFIILSSTTRSEQIRAKALSLGATSFLFRPIQPTVLLEEIEQCLQRRVKGGDTSERVYTATNAQESNTTVTSVSQTGTLTSAATSTEIQT